ncbi:MAG: hypothetical protein FWE67_02910 [Planctomycetaceae bacterium]|nr:hypothetical protein [Planctomycetaceae bacterium]
MNFTINEQTPGSRLRTWAENAPKWGPADYCQERTARFLHRTESLQHRLNMPLIVAMLGGTGTGKSTLVNALAGEKIVKGGKERPTTSVPTLVCHTLAKPETWNLALDGIQIEKRELPLLEKTCFIDCPDPDTTENEELRESNLAQLRKVLPLCDILLITGTQQKYKNQCVLDELAAAAPGARLVFVQTHADRDIDIRNDWEELLNKNYYTGTIYLVDSVRALEIQQQENRNNAAEKLPKDFIELQQLLTKELNEEAAIQIRQANYVDLTEETIDDCIDIIESKWTNVCKLRERITEERERFGKQLSAQIKDELIRDRRVWESRLIGKIASQWGYSPFSLLLRLYQMLGMLASGALLARARSLPQLAVWGTFESVRSLRKLSDKRKHKKSVRTSLAVAEESRLRESALILSGFVSDAELSAAVCETTLVIQEAAKAERSLAEDIGRELENICSRLAAKKDRLWVRIFYETLLGIMLAFLLFRPAKNFFWDTSFYPDAKPFGFEFYLISLFWLLAWCVLIIGLFTMMLRSGLDKEIKTAAAGWYRLSALNGIFGEAEQETNKLVLFRNDLISIKEQIERIKQQAEKLDQRLGRRT